MVNAKWKMREKETAALAGVSGNGRPHSSSSEERRDAKGDLAPGPLFCVGPHFASMASYTWGSGRESQSGPPGTACASRAPACR